MNDRHKQRVFIVSPTESPLTDRGNRHPCLASTLAANGCDLTYLTSDFSHAHKQRFSTAEIWAASQSTPYELEFFPTGGYSSNVSLKRQWWNLRLASLMWRYLKSRIAAQDTLIVPSRPPEFVWLSASLKTRTGCRTVMDIRDVWPDGLPLRKSLTERVFVAYVHAIYRRSVSAIDVCIHTAPSFLQWLNRYAPGKASTFIPLGFDAPRWEGARPLAPAEMAVFPKFIFVGDLTNSMDLFPLLEGLPGRAGATLVHCGGGEALPVYQRWVESHGVEGVEFKGFQPKEQVVRLMSESHIAVIPMRGAIVMPNKLFDAIGACRPILVFGDNDAARFVTENQIGWNLPFGRDAVRQFLIELQPQDVLMRSMRIAMLRTNFTKEKLYTKLAAICCGEPQLK